MVTLSSVSWRFDRGTDDSPWLQACFLQASVFSAAIPVFSSTADPTINLMFQTKCLWAQFSLSRLRSRRARRLRGAVDNRIAPRPVRRLLAAVPAPQAPRAAPAAPAWRRPTPAAARRRSLRPGEPSFQRRSGSRLWGSSGVLQCRCQQQRYQRQRRWRRRGRAASQWHARHGAGRPQRAHTGGHPQRRQPRLRAGAAGAGGGVGSGQRVCAGRRRMGRCVMFRHLFLRCIFQ